MQQSSFFELFLLRSTLRFLLGASTRIAEEAVLAFQIDALELVAQNRDVVVRLHMDESPIAYVSNRGGTRATTRDLPTWADPSDVVDVDIPEIGTSVRDKLYERAELGRSRHPEYYDRAEVSRPLELIASYYEHDSDTVDAVTIADMMSDAGLTDHLEAEAPPPQWVTDAIGQVSDRYVLHRLSGAAAAPMLATLGMFQAVGADDANRAVRRVRTQVPRSAHASPVVVSLASFGTYAKALDAGSNDGAWQAALAAARVFHRRADESRDDARGALTFDEFQVGLHRALGWYLSAKLLYSYVEHHGTDQRLQIPAAFHQECRRGVHFCEEMRVRTLASFSWASGFTRSRRNFAKPADLNDWLSHFGDAAEGRLAVADLSTQLAFPDFVRDIASAWIDAVVDRRSDAAAARLEPITVRLTADSEKIQALGGEAYTYYARSLLKRVRAGSTGDR